ncbi:MAG: TlpA family protein disulfide reductase [Verrucomicrobiaceae bacterium]
MPHLVKMDKRYSKKGLTIIADECQGSSKEDIEAVLKEHKAEFLVTKGVRGPVSSRGIPHAVIFGADGQLLFSGHPMHEDFDKTVKSAMKKVGDLPDPDEEKPQGPLIGERTWKNSDGKPLVASVTSIDGDKVIFKLRGGRTVPYAIDKLSEEDQKLIKEKAGEE